MYCLETDDSHKLWLMRPLRFLPKTDNDCAIGLLEAPKHDAYLSRTFSSRELVLSFLFTSGSCVHLGIVEISFLKLKFFSPDVPEKKAAKLLFVSSIRLCSHHRIANSSQYFANRIGIVIL